MFELNRILAAGTEQYGLAIRLTMLLSSTMGLLGIFVVVRPVLNTTRCVADMIGNKVVLNRCVLI